MPTLNDFGISMEEAIERISIFAGKPSSRTNEDILSGEGLALLPHKVDFYRQTAAKDNKNITNCRNCGAMATFGHMCNMHKRFMRDGNPKQAAHLMRLHDALQRYALTDEPYEDLLFKPNSLDYLKIVREGRLPHEELKEVCETYMARGENIVKEMPKHEPNKEALEWLELAELMSFDEGMRLYYFGN